MGDTFMFMNEMMKAQATSAEEADLYRKYFENKKFSERRYGRAMTMAGMTPYFIACFAYRGMALKFLTFYGLVLGFNAIYDVGMYLRFFVHGPSMMRKIMELDPEENFGSI